jgi:hypothetical protein
MSYCAVVSRVYDSSCQTKTGETVDAYIELYVWLALAAAAHEIAMKLKVTGCR